MSSNLPLVRRSRRVLPWSGGLKLEINIPSQRIRAKWKGGLINEGGVISSEYGNIQQNPRSLGTRLVASTRMRFDLTEPLTQEFISRVLSGAWSSSSAEKLL